MNVEIGGERNKKNGRGRIQDEEYRQIMPQM
jgi:hypothetical protein